MRLTFYLLLLISSFCVSWTHEYHISITQLDYNTETSTLQVAISLHDEEVEFLLDKNIPGITKLEQDLSKKEVDDFLRKYLATSFRILQDGTPLNLQFVGKELEEGALWLYLESSVVPEMPTVEVENTLFLELFDDQANMVHYSRDNQMVESCVLNRMKRTNVFTVDDGR